MRSESGQKNSPDLGAFGYFTAIVLCCTIVGGLAYGLGSQKERRQQLPASYAKAAKEDAERACAAIQPAASFDCIYEKAQSAQEQALNEQDLTAQQSAANSALMSAIIAFFTLILSGVGVWFVRRTLEATVKAVEDTSTATAAMVKQNEIAEETKRPWIKCEVSPIGQSNLTETKLAGAMSLTTLNVGGGIARITHLSQRVRLPNFTQVNDGIEINKPPDVSEFFKFERSAFEFTLLPNEPHNSIIDISVDPRVQSILMPNVGRIVINIEIDVCISYTWLDRECISGYTFHATVVERNSSIVPRVSRGETIPVSFVTFNAWSEHT